MHEESGNASASGWLAKELVEQVGRSDKSVWWTDLWQIKHRSKRRTDKKCPILNLNWIWKLYRKSVNQQTAEATVWSTNIKNGFSLTQGLFMVTTVKYIFNMVHTNTLLLHVNAYQSSNAQSLHFFHQNLTNFLWSNFPEFFGQFPRKIEVFLRKLW
jgi:hypothetical protein